MARIRSYLTCSRGAAQKTRARARGGLLSLVFALAFTAIGARLVDLGLFIGDNIQNAGLNQLSTAVSRPDIVDRRGRILSTDIQTGSLYANPSRVADVDTTAEQLASVLTGVDARVMRKRLTGGGQFMWIARELTPRQQAEIHELGLPGLDFVQEPHRVYPAGATAAHILGTVNVDNRGLAGAENYIDRTLSFTRGYSKSHAKPDPLRLAMDLSVQHAVREELDYAMKTYRAKAAAGLVLDIHSGEILAMTSLPDYDPNRREEALDKERYNRLTSGVFEMGSVFKMFTVAAGLDSGVTGLDRGYDAREPLKVASFTINDFHAKKRWLTVPEIFIYSSNIGSAKMALDIGVTRHKAFLKRLGLLDRLETEQGPSAAPIVPKDWKRLNTMTIAYGHGLSVTPLQMASAASALVNGGYMIEPTFLARTREAAQEKSERVVKLQTSDLMRYLFRLNVQQGSGRRAGAAGFRVGGKTGTAEKVVNGQYSRSALLTSFIGVFPMDAPEYLVLVMLDEPRRVEASGGQATAGVNAAPTAGRIVERIGPMLSVTPVLEEGGGMFDEHLSASY